MNWRRGRSVDDMRGYVDEQHALAQGGSPEDHTAVLPERGTHTRELIENTLPFRLSQVLPTNYLETIGAMIDAGIGWSVLPASLKRPNWVELDLPPMRRELAAIYDPKRQLGLSAQALLQALETTANTSAPIPPPPRP